MVGICGCSFGTWFLLTGNECAGLRLICGEKEVGGWGVRKDTSASQLKVGQRHRSPSGLSYALISHNRNQRTCWLS